MLAETKVESGTSQRISGTCVNLIDIGMQGGRVFLDRDPTAFRLVLNYLRDDTAPPPTLLLLLLTLE